MSSFLQRFLPWRKSGAMTSLDLWRELYGVGPVLSGVEVNYKTALQVSTVLACAAVIARGIAQVPWKLYRESSDGRVRVPAKDHGLYWRLHRQPNPFDTSYEFRETMGLHLALFRNFYAFKNVLGGEVRELLPLEPNRVRVERNTDYTRTYYVTSLTGETREFPAAAIWHVRGLSWNGYQGLDIVKAAREAIGLSIATEAHHARMHKTGIRPSGTYSVEGVLKEDQYKDLRQWLIDNNTGANDGMPLILDRNAKWLSTQMTGVDSQHLETRRYQVEEVCRFMGVMPIMVGYSDKAQTYASAEQMFLAHVVHTLSPWYECIEQSADVHLLTEADRRAGLYAKFVIQGLLRGAMKDTAEYLTKLSTNGVMTRNEARATLELNPIDGLDEPLTPANMNIGASDLAPDDTGA